MTYQKICQRLHDAGIESASWDAALLIEHFCKIPADRVPLAPDEELHSDALALAVNRRVERYPLQYLIGEWQFYRQAYEVSPDCLIPRSDTEILVEEAIRRLPPGAHFADLCTGSGCIAVSILAERPDTTAEALDKYPKTLALATRNAEKNGVRERFTPILADVTKFDCLGDKPRFHAILSNPPYISEEALKQLDPEPCAEPRVALDGGVDGLLFYRAIPKHPARSVTSP